MFECTPFADLDELRSAPQRHDLSVELDCTPAELFAIFEDEDSWPQWVLGLARVDWTSEKPFGVGTTRTVTFQGGGMKVYETFIAWEPGAHMAFTFTGATQRVWWSFGEEYVVTDLGDGRCRLDWTVAYDPRFVLKAIHWLAGPLMGMTFKSITKSLKRYVDENHTE